MTEYIYMTLMNVQGNKSYTNGKSIIRKYLEYILNRKIWSMYSKYILTPPSRSSRQNVC